MPETPPMATATSAPGPTPAERAFLDRWLDSAGAERANKDSFLIDLCDALELPRPEPKRNDPALDTYCFERSVPKLGPDKTSSGAIDLYREGAFVLEAKQGGDGRRFGTAKRNTPAWNMAMQDAYGQALGYARATRTSESACSSYRGHTAMLCMSERGARISCCGSRRPAL